jgi:hypothetical protein
MLPSASREKVITMGRHQIRFFIAAAFALTIASSYAWMLLDQPPPPMMPPDQPPAAIPSDDPSKLISADQVTLQLMPPDQPIEPAPMPPDQPPKASDAPSPEWTAICGTDVLCGKDLRLLARTESRQLMRDWESMPPNFPPK